MSDTLSAEGLHELADVMSEVMEALSRKENAEDETVTRGLFLIASAITSLAMATYELAAGQRRL